MTLPYERYRAVQYAREFLQDLLDPKKTPKVPREIRQRALSVLRHYPYKYDMENAAQEAPDVFAVTSPLCKGDTREDAQNK
jgi:hypothetical protein